MRSKRKQRLIFVLVLIFGVGSAAGLAIYAFNQNMLYFYSPAQVAAGEAPTEKIFRIGGLVVEGSVQHADDGITKRFALTDNQQAIEVVYAGLLPNLFREGQGIVALGKLDSNGVFTATEVLAKHDENYMPPEVAEMLEQSGASHPASIPKSYQQTGSEIQ